MLDVSKMFHNQHIGRLTNIHSITIVYITRYNNFQNLRIIFSLSEKSSNHNKKEISNDDISTQTQAMLLK